MSFFCVCATSAAVLLGCSNTTPSSRIDTLAQAKFKQQTYVMEYKGTPVGTHRTGGQVNEQNQLVYTQEFVLTSMQNTSFMARHTLSFSPDAPNLLDEASLEKFGADKSAAYETVQIKRGDLGLTVLGTEIRSGNLPQDYALEHFLGIESWLMKRDIALGDKLSLISIRLEQRESLPHEWTVVERTPASVLIRSSEGVESEYDTSNIIPQLTISRHPSGLTLRHVDDLSQANTPSVSKLSRQATTVPISGALPRPSELSLLELSVSFANGEPGPWRSRLTPSGTLLIDHTPAAESIEASYVFDNSSTDWHSNTEEIRHLAQSITDGLASEDEILKAIVEFVHEYVDYSKSDTPQSISTTLRRKTGDCSDIADFLNALAVASGFESRTVYGLAYDKASRSFGIHAWNQVRLQDDQLRIVDPTWNQVHADATHIEFPEAYAHEVMGSLVGMKLSVIRYEHFDSHI